MSDAMVLWPVPGVQYASIHIPLRDTYVAEDGETYQHTDQEMIEQAHDVATKLYAAFPPQGATKAPERAQGASGGQRRAAPRQQREGTGLFCEDHPSVEVIETQKKWQEFDDDGNPDKFFCPGKENGTGENHNVFRRQTLARATSVPPDDGPDIDPDDLPF